MEHGAGYNRGRLLCRPPLVVAAVEVDGRDTRFAARPKHLSDGVLPSGQGERAEVHISIPGSHHTEHISGISVRRSSGIYIPYLIKEACFMWPMVYPSLAPSRFVFYTIIKYNQVPPGTIIGKNVFTTVYSYCKINKLSRKFLLLFVAGTITGKNAFTTVLQVDTLIKPSVQLYRQGLYQYTGVSLPQKTQDNTHS